MKGEQNKLVYEDSSQPQDSQTWQNTLNPHPLRLWKQCLQQERAKKKKMAADLAESQCENCFLDY